jgi:hypothetical protein
MVPFQITPRHVRAAGCPAAEVLEARIAGERTAATEAHLSACAGCRRYIEELEQAQRAFLTERPAERFVAELRARTPSPAPSVLRPAWLGRWQIPAFAALVAPALACVAALMLLRPPPSPSPESPNVRLKGARLEVLFLRRGMTEPSVVTDETLLRPGDRLRFAFAAPRAGHLLILGRDGTGAVAAYYPTGAARSFPVRPEDPSTLPGAVALDEAPGPEEVYLVFSERPEEFAPLAEEVRAGRAPSCGGCTTLHRTLRKAR